MSRAPFDISAATAALADIGAEIKRLKQSLAKAKEIEAKIKNDISTFMEVNKHQGIMINNTTILKQEKEVQQRLKKKEKEEKLKSALGEIATPELLDRIKNASKGATVIKKTITVETK
jgi:hypothetical protein